MPQNCVSPPFAGLIIIRNQRVADDAGLRVGFDVSDDFDLVHK